MRVEDSRAAAALLDPLRARILEALRDPASATEVSRSLGLPAARINHHIHRLRRAGLIRRAGSRRVRNLIEVLYVATARTFVVSESLTPGGEARRKLRADEARRPLRNLAALGDRLAGDALVLLDEAASGEREVSAFATSLELAFPDASARAAFLADLLEAVRSLQERYGARGSANPDERYRAILACYPEVRI
jgi:DNA-binding transcriptional ArsR family regulator